MFESYGLRVTRVHVRPIDAETIAQSRRIVELESQYDPRLSVVNDVASQFLSQSEGYEDAVRELSQTLLDGDLEIGSGRPRWTAFNNTAFMAFGVGDGDAFLRLSEQALTEIPDQPLTLLTRALVHAAGEDYGAARSAVDAAMANLSTIGADPGPWTMYLPTFLVRGDKHPQVGWTTAASRI